MYKEYCGNNTAKTALHLNSICTSRATEQYCCTNKETAGTTMQRRRCISTAFAQAEKPKSTAAQTKDTAGTALHRQHSISTALA